MNQEIKSLLSRRQAAREAYKQRIQSQTSGALQSWLRLHRRMLILAVSLLVGLPLLSIVADLTFHAGKIHSKVMIGEVAVGGLSREEARKKVDASATAALKRRFVITHKNKSWSLQKSSISPAPDIKGAVSQAYNVGRTGNISQQLSARFATYRKARVVNLGFSYDQSALDGFIAEISKSVDVPAKDAAVEIEDGEAVIKKSAYGLAVKRSVLKDLLIGGFYSQRVNKAALPVGSVAPKLNEEHARQAAKQAKLALSAPVLMEYGDEQWTLSTGDIRALLDFVPKKNAAKAEITVGMEKDGFNEKIATLTSHLRRDPKDARFAVSGNSVSIVAHSEGEEIDGEAARRAVETQLSRPGPRKVTLLLHKIDPEITTARAKTMGIKERIAGYTTDYNPGMTSRVINIRTLARALNGTLVAPGKIFSFNGTIGPRTAAKGYKEAPVIRDGKLVPDLGGGVCQVATTTFNAIFFAGLPIEERRNHSLYISHYPDGRDASVSYPSPDLKFKNDTGAYILISAYASTSQVTVTFYGTDPDREVTYTTSGFMNFRPFKTERMEDPQLEEGKEVVEESGKPGRMIVVRRKVKQDGKLLYDAKFTSVYRTINAIVRVGTKKVEKASTGDAGATSNSD